MLLDHRGRAIVRRKQYGLTRPAAEYILADPPAAAELEIFDDAIGSHVIATDEGSPHDDSPRTY